MNPEELSNPDIQLLYELVATPSVSGDELNASNVFVRHADRMGFETTIDEVGNAIAERGPADDEHSVHLMLLGHIDTVPGDIPVRIEDGILHGRGSVDAKGPLAAMLAAASVADLSDSVRISVIGAVGEEAAESVGARHIVNKYSPDACVIGEPSGFDGVTLGYKGRLLCDASVNISNAHSAGEELSAPDLLMQWWREITDRVSELNSGHDRVFDQVQASVLSMDSASNGLTQRAHIRIGFRLPVQIQADQMRSILQEHSNEQIKLAFSGFEDAHATDRNDPVVRAISTSIRALGNRPRPKLKTGTADLNVVAPIWNCPIAAYGPGDSALDHRPDEHIVLEEYIKSIAVLKGAIEALAEEIYTQKTEQVCSV